MNRRLNITLPEQTVRLLDRAAPKGERSRLIDDAIRQYLTKAGKAALRSRLEEGYRKNATRDLELAADWVVPGDEVWRKTRK